MTRACRSASWPVLLALLTAPLAAEETPIVLDEEDIRQWTRQLGAPAYEDRERATQELARFGSAAIPELVHVCNSEDPEVRSRAQGLIRNITRTLAEKLSADDWERAWHGLKRAGELAIPELTRLDQFPEPQTQTRVVRLLAQMRVPSATRGLVDFACHGEVPASELALLELSRRSATAELLECMENAASDAIQERAAQAMLRLATPEMLPKLWERLADPERASRHLVLRLIVGLDPRVSIDRLLPLLEEKEECIPLRVETIAVLGQMGGPEAGNAILRVLRRMDPNTLGEASAALARLKRPELLPFLREQLAAKEWRIRQAALIALARAGLPEAFPDVEQRLSDPDRSVRLAALISLGMFGGAKAIPRIVPFLAEEDAEFRFEAVMALRRINGHSPLAELASVPGLHLLVRNPAAQPYLVPVVDAYRQENSEEAALDAVVQGIYKHDLLRHPEPEVRFRAAIALYRCGEGVGRPVILEAMQSSDTFVRLAAAEHLGPIADPKAIPPLIEALDNSEESLLVRRAAAYSLGMLDAQNACPTLLAILADETEWPELRKVAAVTLATLHHDPAVPKFRQFLRHDDLDVRLGAASGLATLGDRDCVPAFLTVLREGTPSQQRAAALCLKQFTGRPVPVSQTSTRAEREESIRRWQEWWDTENRKNP